MSGILARWLWRVRSTWTNEIVLFFECLQSLICVFSNYHYRFSWKIKKYIRFKHQDLLEYYHWAMKSWKLDGCGHIHRTDICDSMSFIFNLYLGNKYWIFFFVRTFTLQKKQKYISAKLQCCLSWIDLVSHTSYNWIKPVCFADGMLFTYTQRAMFTLL